MLEGFCEALNTTGIDTQLELILKYNCVNR